MGRAGCGDLFLILCPLNARTRSLASGRLPTCTPLPVDVTGDAHIHAHRSDCVWTAEQAIAEMGFNAGRLEMAAAEALAAPVQRC